MLSEWLLADEFPMNSYEEVRLVSILSGVDQKVSFRCEDNDGAV